MESQALNTLIAKELDATSVSIDLPWDETASLIFYDYPTLEERSRDPGYYADDIHSKAIFYYMYQSLPELVDGILASPGLSLVVELSTKDTLPEVAEAWRIFAWWSDRLVLQSSLLQSGDSVVDIDWANHPQRYEVGARVLRRRLLANLLCHTQEVFQQILYLPLVSVYSERAPANPSAGRTHAMNVAQAVVRLDGLPLVSSLREFGELRRVNAGGTLTLPYISGLPLRAVRDLSQCRSCRSERLLALLHEATEGQSLPGRFPDILTEFDHMSTALRYQLDALLRRRELQRLGGKLASVRAQLLVLSRKSRPAQLVISLAR